MRTLSKLFSAPAIAGMLGAGALAFSVPAAARDYHYGHQWRGHETHWGGHHWRGRDNHWGGHHWRGRDRDGWGWGPNVSFGFYGGYPYYGSDYYGYPRSRYCDPDSWYYDPDDCDGGYYGYYGDWED